MTASSPDHCCLRPEFTRQLADRLAEGGCINLVSPHGQGRRRTLKDLHHLLSGSIHILQVNLRDCADNAQSMAADLCRQAGCAGDGLAALAAHLSHQDGQWLLILHNFDELHPGTESGFDKGFFDALNTLADQPDIALLYVSEQAIGNRLAAMEILTLPPVTTEQLLAEIQRRNLPLPQTEQKLLATWLLEQPAPYTLLEEMQDTLPGERPWMR